MIEKIMAAADCFGQWYQKLLKSCFFLSAIAVILFQPSYFTQLPVLDKVYDVLQILAGLCIGICYLAEIVRKRRINPIVALVAVYYGILILSTLLNQRYERHFASLCKFCHYLYDAGSHRGL
ncbi:MAG: hypothetical protein ACLT1K_01700 [[Clostridium] leptum]